MYGDCQFSVSFEIILGFPRIVVDYGIVVFGAPPFLPCRITGISLVLMVEGLRSGTSCSSSTGISGDFWLSQCHIITKYLKKTIIG